MLIAFILIIIGVVCTQQGTGMIREELADRRAEKRRLKEEKRRNTIDIETD